MYTIVKIGYHRFLLHKEANAFAAVKALAGALELRHDYISGVEYYWPEESQPEIGLKIVKPSQILASKPHPGEAPEQEVIITPPPRKPKLLGYAKG